MTSLNALTAGTGAHVWVTEALKGDPAVASQSTGIWDDIQTEAQSCQMMAAIMPFQVIDSMMVKCGIRPNDPRNGIYLRGYKRYSGTSGYTALSQSDRIAAPHKAPFVHTIHQFEIIDRREGCRRER